MNKKSYSPLVWFVLGFGIFLFTRMSKIVPTIPIAILIAPIFILRFIRTQPTRRGILLTLLGFIVSINIGLWGLFDLDDGALTLFFNVFRSSLLAVLYSLPYMIDRVTYPKFRKIGIASSLIYPTITTAIFFLSSLEGPFDGAVQAGKFVYGPTIFQQLLSLFGVWSFIFVSSWFASIINYSWENNFDWSKSKKTAITVIAIVIAIFSFGAIKTFSSSSERDTVSIAAIVLIPEERDPVSMDKIWADRLVSPFEKSISRIGRLTETAASNDVKIVSFQEFAMTINEEDEERLREAYKEIAKENDVYLSITYAYFAKEGKGENKHLLIDNNGEIQLDYTKRYVSGLAELDLGEAGVYRKGPEIIQSVDTPYGRIAISICRDMEFPHYMRQAGRDDVDIMLSPAYEWPKGLVVHSVYMRGIEYGFSLVRPTYNGITIAQDFNGRILSQMDSDETDDGILYADIPTRGVNTLYTKIGDVLGWICVIGLLGLIPLSIVLRIKHKKEEA
jgi:apolipoprotein N-acyltransferase